MCHTVAAKALTWPLVSTDRFTLARQGWHTYSLSLTHTHTRAHTHTHKLYCRSLVLVLFLQEHQCKGCEGEGKNGGMSPSRYGYVLYPTLLLLLLLLLLIFIT